LGVGVRGLVDHLRIWGKALTEDEILNTFNIFSSQSATGTTALNELPGVRFSTNSWAKAVLLNQPGEAPEGNNFANPAEVLGEPDNEFYSMVDGSLTDQFLGLWPVEWDIDFDFDVAPPPASGHMQLDLGEDESAWARASGDSRDDIYVFERLSQKERVAVLVSTDGDAWYFAGFTDGGVSGVDLDTAPLTPLHSDGNGAIGDYGFSTNIAVSATIGNPGLRNALFRYVWLVARGEIGGEDEQLSTLRVPGPDIDAIGVPSYGNSLDFPLAWYPVRRW
jgi:hypothetical protein